MSGFNFGPHTMDPMNPTESLEFSGTPSQLGVIIISTNGTFDFGTRSVTSQQWWQVGDRGWDKDGEVTLLEASRSDGDTLTAGVNADAFDTITSLTARKTTKAGLRSGFAYESSVSGQEIGKFTVSPLQTAVSQRKAFWGYTGRWTDDMLHLVTSSYSSLTGNFSDGDNTEFIAGETFSGVTSAGTGSTVFTGYIVKEDTGNSLVSFRFGDAFSYSSTQNNGAVITGDTSGAEATFDGVTFLLPSALKMTRSDTDQNITPTSPETALAFTHSPIQLILQTRTSDFGTDDDRPSLSGMQGSDWETWSWQADYSTADYVGETIREGVVTTDTYTNPNSIDFDDAIYEMHHILIATDWAGDTNQFGHFFARMKDPHMDYELNRVVLGNNATFSSCTKTAVCRSESWNSTRTEARLNYGEIPSATETFVFIYNSSGVCVNPTAGLSIGNAP